MPRLLMMTFTPVIIVFVSISSLGCAGDDDASASQDLTVSIVGTYANALIVSDSLDFLSADIPSIVISRISDTEIDISLETNLIGNTLFSATMNDQNTFTVPAFLSSGTTTYSGIGSFEDDVLSIQLTSSSGETQLITNDLTILFFPGNYQGDYSVRPSPNTDADIFPNVSASITKKSNNELTIELLNEPTIQATVELYATIQIEEGTIGGTNYNLQPVSIGGKPFTGFGFINRFTPQAETLIITLVSENDNEIRQYQGPRL